MKNDRSEFEIEKRRLEQTILIIKGQLEQAKLANENNEAAIIEAKREMRENAVHSVGNLWSSEGFEDLATLSQYANPIMIKLAEHETIEKKIIALERLIESPYFARIDFKFDDEDAFENIYIGRSSLMNDDTCDMYVYDWRSPIASLFYQFAIGPAFYEAPSGRITGEVGLKRQYEIKNGALEYFFDTDVQVIDEFLRKLLSKNTSPGMKTIVETIQKEQDTVIRDVENELMMVQGVAGSGKTSIALHRAAYLMYQGFSAKLAANNILIISPNALFEQYISQVLPELGEDNVVSMVFEEMLVGVLQIKQVQTRHQFLEMLMTNPRYRDTMKSSIAFKTSHEFLEILNRLIHDLPYRWIDFEDVYYNGRCVVNKEVLKDKIISGKKNVPLGMRLKQLEDFIVESVKEVWKNDVSRAEYAELRKEIQKFTDLDVKGFYHKLFHDRSYFYHLAEGLALPDCTESILTFTQENISSSTLYYDDAAVLSYLSLKLKGAGGYENIKQVVVDEAQDYYPLHYEIFNLLFPGSKYTILGDINQTLEKQEDLSLYEQIGKILNKKKSTLVTMDKSFRCTRQILHFSSKFIPQGADIKSFNREGSEPEIYVAPDRPSLCDRIITETELCLKEGYQSIALICKTEKNALVLFKELKDRIDVKIVQNESETDLQGIFIIPVYMSKGLEFDTVFICDVNQENYHSEDDKKLLYIASTRALHRLSLLCEGEISPWLESNRASR